jgi:hypothetical protein
VCIYTPEYDRPALDDNPLKPGCGNDCGVMACLQNHIHGHIISEMGGEKREARIANSISPSVQSMISYLNGKQQKESARADLQEEDLHEQRNLQQQLHSKG